MDTNHCQHAHAKALYLNGMPDLALDAIRTHLEASPSDLNAWEFRGMMEHNTGRFESALHSFGEVIRHRRLAPAAQLAFADSSYFVGDEARAETLLRELSLRDGLHRDLLPNLAHGLARANAFLAAIDVCKRAAMEDPTCHRARFGVAYHMTKAGYPPELVYPILVNVTDMAPNVFCYRMSQATVLSRMGMDDRAYLAVADASADELRTIHCLCCVQRLTTLYRKAGDGTRTQFCRRQLAKLRSNLGGDVPC